VGFSAGLSFLALSAWADTDASVGSATVFPLPEVLVTATQPEAPTSLVVREDNEGDIKAWNARTAGEALTQVPGISVQYGGSSGDARAWIRGFRDRDTLVLFDGIPIASAFEGTIDLNEIAVNEVSSIRVIKSAPSVIYGTNGMAGVIDVIPRWSAERSGFGGAIELGENDREVYRARYSGGDASLNYLASGSFETADDYSLSDGWNPQLNQPSGDRVNSDFDRSSLFLQASSDQSPLGETSVFYNFSDVDRGMVPQAGVEDPDFERLTKSRRQTIGLSNHFSAIPLSAKLYYNQYDIELRTYTDDSYTEIDEVEEGEDYAWGGKLYSRLETHDNNTLILFGAYNRDVYEADDVFENTDRAELNTYNLALEDQFWITDRFSLAAGGIYTWFEQEQSGDELTAFNPQLALGYQLTDSLKFHASAAQRTRFPKLRELYRRRYGNPDLKEQTANNFDIGVSYSHFPGYVTDVSFFYSDIKDLIERPSRRDAYENLDDVSIEGVEASSGGWSTPWLYTRVSYTYVDAADDLPDGEDRQLRSRPKHTAQAELRVRPVENLLVSLNSIYVNNLYDLDENNAYVKLPSYIVTHAKVAYTLRQDTAVYVSVSNITDTNYEQKLGYPREGRAISIGLEFFL
jgi:vitamin B12 transporter